MSSVAQTRRSRHRDVSGAPLKMKLRGTRQTTTRTIPKMMRLPIFALQRGRPCRNSFMPGLLYGCCIGEVFKFVIIFAVGKQAYTEDDPQ